MKTQYLFLLLFCASVGLLLPSCSDNCKSTVTYRIYEPVFMPLTEFRESASVLPAQSIAQTGKIYVYGSYLLVSEPEKGIHIFDNANPSSPRALSFISLLGNLDIAVKDNILYADSYVDLVVIDISNPIEPVIHDRILNVFPYRKQYDWYYINDTTFGVVSGWEEKMVSNVSDCDSYRSPWGYPVFEVDGSFGGGGVVSPNFGGNKGVGGSMARFAITDDFLYTVSDQSLKYFDVSSPMTPVEQGDISIGFGIETIFPYGSNLFIGAQDGMHIFNNENPALPVQVSSIQHVRACDPVVVEGNFAYVTLRSGNECAGFTNQLEVIDIQDIANPTRITTFPMAHPYGLGVDGDDLFVCEGDAGLKRFDNSIPVEVGNHIKETLADIDAYDVIPLGELLIVVGKDGIYQFSYTGELTLLSHITTSSL